MANLSLYDLNLLVNTQIANLQNQINGKQATIVEDSTHRWFTDAQKSKLAGIQTGAEVNQNAFSIIKVDTAMIYAENKTDTLEIAAGSNIQIVADITGDKITINNTYAHPSTHLASIITQDATHRFVTDTQISTWNAKSSTAVATTSANGLMSAADKTKLNNIQSGAQVNLTPIEMMSALSGIDGNGSGLDADTVDGKHANSFADANHTHVKANITDFAHTHNGNEIVTSVSNALTADGLNVISGNTVVFTKGFNGGTLYVNQTGATAAISEYRMCDGLSNGLANIRAKEVYADLHGTADYANNSDKLDGYQASDFVLNNGGILYGPLKIGDASTQLLKGDLNTLRIQTPLGRMDIGVQDSSFCYLNTDRPAFLFNQSKIYADGKRVWHEGNMGHASGMDADKLDGHDWADVYDVMKNSFTQTLSNVGWTKLPNGVVFQWGVMTPTSPTTIMFPMTFPNACFGVVISNQDNTAVAQDKGAFNVNKNSFEVNFGSGNSFWFAVGF